MPLPAAFPLFFHFFSFFQSLFFKVPIFLIFSRSLGFLSMSPADVQIFAQILHEAF